VVTEPFLFDKDADLVTIRPARALAGMHKADCKLLKDADLNGLFSLDWDNFKGHIGFPLNNATVCERSGLVPS
jgi:hypothetical protein